MSRRAVRSIAMVLFAGLFLGCGGASRKSHHHARPEPASRASSREKPSSGVAATTRAVTLGRRGDWSLTSDKVREVAPLVRRAAAANRVSDDLLFGIIWVESRFNPKAVSPVGARGLMQLMPLTARYLAEQIAWKGGTNPFDPSFNVAAGSYYIAALVREFDGDEDLALAAYNAGPTKVRRWLRGSGLPRVSVEYATMVQTARGFFRGAGAGAGTGRGARAPITDDGLDRLGLAILIAGLSDTKVGLDREDDPHPLE